VGKLPGKSPRIRAPAPSRVAGDALSTVFLPAACRLCEELLTRGSRLPICNDGLASYSHITGEVCHICGRPAAFADNDEADVDLAGQAQSVSIACRHDTFHFDLARSFARHENSLVRAIVLLKFADMEFLANWFAARLAEAVRQRANDLQADWLVPLPLHKDRHRERGFNQAEVLSKRLSKRLKIPHPGGTPGQKALAAGQAFAHFPRTLGRRSWRFCHTSGQPS
jgi:predicted amidophosphoribosyltransferase